MYSTAVSYQDNQMQVQTYCWFHVDRFERVHRPPVDQIIVIFPEGLLGA